MFAPLCASTTLREIVAQKSASAIGRLANGVRLATLTDRTLVWHDERYPQTPPTDGPRVAGHLYTLDWAAPQSEILTVATAHTFFVGEGQWLVHNQCNKWWIGDKIRSQMKNKGWTEAEIQDVIDNPAETLPGRDIRKNPTTGLPENQGEATVF